MIEIKDKKNRPESNIDYNVQEYEDKNLPLKAFLGIVIVIIMLIICALGVYSLVVPPKNGADMSILDKMIAKFLPQANNKRFDIQIFNKRQNILLLGVDSNGENTDPFNGTRTDTIILVNIDPHDKSVKAISIPRDSKVYIADDHGVQKINSAHAYGGIKLAKRTIEDTLGVKIDKYVLVNNAGVVKLVDAIGGVPVYVEKNMHYNDYSGNLHINLSKGEHLLNGKQSEGYLRFRKDGLGDIGRTSRQQWFLRGLMDKLQSPATFAKIPEVLNIAQDYIKTDMSLYELSHLAALMRGIDMDSIEVATLPGAPSKKGSISYWILDPDKTQEIINRMIYRDKVAVGERKLTAGIIYAPAKETEARQVKAKLEELGYDVNCVGRRVLPHSQILGHDKAVNAELISFIKKKIPEIKQTQFVYDPDRYYCVQSDFTIIMSHDIKQVPVN